MLTWAVGAARIREVDEDWPAVGARIHHSVGAWPVLISDTTVVEEVDAPHAPAAGQGVAHRRGP